MPIRLLFLFASVSSAVWGQVVSIDWPSRTLRGCNAVSGATRTVVVTLQDLNDHLYKYRVEFDVQATAPNDFQFLASGIGKPSSGAADMQAALDQLEADLGQIAVLIKNSPLLTAAPESNGKFRSVPIAETQAGWRVVVEGSAPYSRVAGHVRILRGGTFPDGTLEARRVAALAGADRLARTGDFILNSPHRLAVPVAITPGADNTIRIRVSELAGGQITGQGLPEEFTCSIRSTVLSLSAGILVSKIAPREYNLRPVPRNPPVMGQSETVNSLAVENAKSLQPTGVALLNYQVPKADWLSISSGPTYRLSGTSAGNSPFGFFVGPSVNLWNRFFLTPGAHLGHFADYPAGLVDGSVVPAGIGTPVAVKRWTIKFGFSFTYRTVDFSGLDLGVRAAAAPKPESTKTESPKTEAPKVAPPKADPVKPGGSPIPDSNVPLPEAPKPAPPKP